MTDASLEAIKVTSGRTYAVAQFNMPAVQLWLPRLTNSAYATEEFAKPRLGDAKGQPVEYELEGNLYVHDEWENEIRFQTKGEPARMIGKIHVRYPTRIRSATAAHPQQELTKPAPFVKLPPVFVEQWKNIEITYDLPVLPKLPISKLGNPPHLPKKITETPGGKVEVRIEQ